MLQQNIKDSYIKKLELLSGKKIDKIQLKELIDSISGKNKKSKSLSSSFLESFLPSNNVGSLEKFISEKKATTFSEKIIKDEVCDSGFDQTPELHLMIKLCLNETFLDVIDKIDDQELLSYIAEVLIEIYDETKSNDILLKLQYTLKKCREESCDNIIKYLSDQSDPNILRILYFFFKNKDKSTLNLLDKSTKDILFARLSQKSQHEKIDPIVFGKCTSLFDKISLFYKSSNYSDLSNLLAISYVVDRGFYDHLESVILHDDEFLPKEYSFNPYGGKTATLQRAISNLLNVVVVDEVKKPGGVEYMQELIRKYNPYIKNNPNFSHPIFYLVNEKMWKELEAWIEKEPELLLAKDSNGKTPLISTILTFAHGHVKSNEHDSLLKVQKLAIEKYIESFLEHDVFIKPSVALFTSFSEYRKLTAELARKNEHNAFVKTSFFYYENLLKHFINVDSKLNKNSFLNAEVTSGSNHIPFYKFILQSGFKINYGDEIKVSNHEIVLKDQQISKVFPTQMELLNEIYSNLFDNEKNKINQNVDLVLANLLEEARRCTKIDDSLIAKMIKDFIDLKYSEEFVEKDEIQNKLYKAILEIIRLPAVNFKEFCIGQPDTFRMICNMGEHEIVKELERSYVHPEDYTKLIQQGIIAFWYANTEQSDPIAAKNFSEIALTLNKLLSANNNVVRLEKKINRAGAIETTYFSTSFPGKLLSEKATFSLDLIKEKNNSIDLYNKAIRTIASLFLWDQEQVNFLKPSSYIKLSLLALGNPKHHSDSMDERQKMLHQASCSLDSNDPEDKKFLEELEDATSNLWDNIRNLGCGRGKMFFEHLIDRKIIDNKEPFLSRFIKQSIMMNDVESAINWIKEDKSLIPHALEVSVSVLNSKALSMIVDEFGLPNTERNLFGILYEHSKSKMMDDPDFKRSTNEIAVKLLTSGYQIELIEEAAKNLDYSEFVKDLAVTQMKYSASVKGIGYLKNLMPINGVSQFAMNTVANFTTKCVTAKAAQNVYDRAFDFIYEKLSQNHTIDISQFCHVFSSTLQPPHFISRLKKIPFLSGFRENFDKEKDREIILKNAKEVIPLIPVNLHKIFITKSLSEGIGNHKTFESLKEYFDSLPMDEQMNEYQEQKNFLLDRFDMFYKELPAITHETKVDFKELVASTTASAVSGTFLYLNDPDFRNAAQGIIAILPTISSGISVANSITANTLTVAANCINETSNAVVETVKGIVRNNHEIAYTALYLAIGGGVLYLSYKMYQEYMKIQENKLTDNISINIETIKELAKKFQAVEKTFIRNISDDEIYKFLKKLSDGEFVEQEKFFTFCKRFGITPEILNRAMEENSSDSMLIISHALSLNTMYLNAIEVKKAFDKIHQQEKFNHKNEIVEFLYYVAVSEVSNKQLAMTTLKIPTKFHQEISKLEIKGNKPLIDDYNPEKHDMYLYVLQNANRISLTEEQQRKISSDPFMAFVLKLSDALKGVGNCHEVETDVVVRREYISLM